MSGDIVLASSSPRRREILARLKIAVEVVTPDVDEQRRPEEPAADFARRAAREKADAVARELAKQQRFPWIIAADTVVVIDGEPLGKPRDDAQARQMLTALSGRVHRVMTGWSVLKHEPRCERSDVEVTRVRFKQLSPEEIAGYVATGEGRDKAGSYGIQGLGCFLVAGIEGNYENVVGLPACPIVDTLRALGAVDTYPPRETR